jgi:hypothetical protein
MGRTPTQDTKPALLRDTGKLLKLKTGIKAGSDHKHKGQ